MLWKLLIVGIGLLLVFEGIMPFLSPRGYRRFVKKLAQSTDTQLRSMGLISMIIGLVILFVAKQLLNL